MKTILRESHPIIFQNKDFQTIQIKVIFPFKREEKNIAMMHLLPGMLHHLCQKYPTEREYSLEMQKLFILFCYCSGTTLINESYFQFTFMVPDVLSLKQDLLEEQFQFFAEMMYHPKTNQNQFCKEEFQREVDNLKVDIDKAFQDNGSYAFMQASRIIDPEGNYSDSIYNHQEQIDQVSPKSLYQFYLDTIHNNEPFIYVFGNVNQKHITELCKKYFYRKPVPKKKFEIETKNYLPIRSKVNDVVEKSQFRNSVYACFYKVKDMCEEDEVLLSVVHALLSSQSSRLLSQTLRTENDLVYHASSMTSNSYGILGIFAFIHRQNLEIVKEKIHEVLGKLKDEKIIAPCLDNIKERHRISLIRELDDKASLFREAIYEKIGFDITNMEYHEKLMKIQPKDIVVFMDRLVLDTKYFLEEGDHE
ncbi:MAG: insulinase family protein [Bacilli bacterium]|nr:insulinase family protein [Bacilli bacterium]